MTDEERQKLCEWLRHLPAYISERGSKRGIDAAEEIERLAGQLDEAKQIIATLINNARKHLRAWND